MRWGGIHWRNTALTKPAEPESERQTNTRPAGSNTHHRRARNETHIDALGFNGYINVCDYPPQRILSNFRWHEGVHCRDKVDDSSVSPTLMRVVASVCHNNAPFRTACFKCFHMASQVAVKHGEHKLTAIHSDKYLKAATCLLSSGKMQLSLK